MLNLLIFEKYFKQNSFLKKQRTASKESLKLVHVRGVKTSTVLFPRRPLRPLKHILLLPIFGEPAGVKKKKKKRNGDHIKISKKQC